MNQLSIRNDRPVTRQELLSVVLLYALWAWWSKQVEDERLWLDIEDHLAATRA
jgi:hypothetical protein